MALKHSAVEAGGILAVVLAQGCGANAGIALPATTQTSASTSVRDGARIPSSSKMACALGQLSNAVPRLGIDALLANPQPYFGRQLALRGYFILDGVETTALLEPTKRQAHIQLSIKRLPAKSAEQLLACRLKLVDVQGYITYVPSRGGEAPIIFAEAMGDITK